MENDIQEQLAHQQEILRDLQSQLAQSTDEEEKKSLQLKMNVVDAKIKELQAKQSSATVNEGTPENTKDFHNAITDGEYSDKLDESMPQGYSKSQFLKKDIPEAIKVIEKELSFAKQHTKDERNAFALLRGDFEAIEHFAEMVKSNCKELGNYETKGMLSESQGEGSWKVGDRVKIKDNYFDSMPSSYFNKQKGKISKVFKDYVAVELDKPVLGDKSIAVAFNGLIKENANMLNESLPSNYSKSKYLKEVQDATKAIRSVCDRIDKLAKKGDEWSMYSLPSDFKSIANFAERCAEDSKDIYSYMKKGTLTEAVSKNQLQTGSILYFPELKTYWIVGGTVFNNQLKLYKCDKNGKLPKLLGEREIMAVTNNDLQKAQLVKTLSRDEIKQVNLTEAVHPQDKAQWADAVKFGKAHGHPAPKLKLGQKTSKGEVVALWYGRLSAAPMYSVLKDGGTTVKEYYEEELMEGCMTKKFENMTNREIASYIFSHPHTKFASKMKECDDKEIMKAIRAMKKTEEEAPVTNTSAVATTEVPSMFMKKKLNESVDSDITDILDDVKNMYGEKARRDLRDEIYHRNYLVTRDSFASYVKQLSKTGMLRDFIEAIINRDTYTFDKIVKKLK